MLLVRSVICVLCAVGFYASVFMLRKGIRAQRGELAEPSVVQTPRAKLFAGVPNALIGIMYYPAMAAVSWSALQPAVRYGALAAALLAAATSAFLAYSLLFVTKRSCSYCWAAHLTNWALLAAVSYLLVLA